jgi:tRNA modification GTPase
MDETDTIVATATTLGIGALAVVRVSGPAAHRVAGALLRQPLSPARVAALRTLRAMSGEVLDEAIMIVYQNPHSYTGEDSVEIICHGGWVTPPRITQALVELGARPALPGEFTRRAVLNGKLDLLQAEAVNDLIRAESTAGANLALQQLDGGLSQRILELRENILNIEALVAYEIDFPEEDDGPVEPARIQEATERTIDSVDRLIMTTPRGELVRQGAVVAIVGPPNVGKSSLFNALLGRQRALVTEIPGTTRDALEALLDVAPVPLRLVDTAGLRESTDRVEQLGVAVSREYLQQAAAVLACGDSVETLAEALASAQGAARGIVIPVRTKGDLAGATVDGASEVSAVTGEGLDALVTHVSTLIAQQITLAGPESPVVTHARYRHVLVKARDELIAFRDARHGGAIPTTVSAVHLHEGVRILGELVGGVDIEEVLGKVFSAFCVGK